MPDTRPSDDPDRILDECRDFDVAQRRDVHTALDSAYRLARRQVFRSAMTAGLANATERDEAALLADARVFRAINVAKETFLYGADHLLLTEAQRALFAETQKATILKRYPRSA